MKIEYETQEESKYCVDLMKKLTADNITIEIKPSKEYVQSLQKKIVKKQCVACGYDDVDRSYYQADTQSSNEWLCEECRGD